MGMYVYTQETKNMGLGTYFLISFEKSVHIIWIFCSKFFYKNKILSY